MSHAATISERTYPRFIRTFIMPFSFANFINLFFRSPVHLGSFKCFLYKLSVGIGQKVFCKREPSNASDSNAIIVCTYDWEPIGHFKKEDAKFLSTYMNYDCCFFGYLTDSAHGSFNTSMIITEIIESRRFKLFTWKLHCIYLSWFNVYSQLLSALILSDPTTL